MHQLAWYKVRVEDPGNNGLLWAKDGAATGWTMGSCSGILAELFLKGTTLPVEDGADPYDVHPGNLCRAKVLVFTSARGTPFAAGGDSGAGVFTLTRVARKWCLVEWQCPCLLGTAAM